MRVLVTGGAGYIGSHTCLELLLAGHEVIVVDNLSNSKFEALRRVQELAARPLQFHQDDVLDRTAMARILGGRGVDAVIHFAGLKAVGESVTVPLQYYQNNVAGAMGLCEVMEQHGVRNMVFSSSAAVYGEASTVPITEDQALHPASPYGRTKWMVEEILRDLHLGDARWNVVLLRYFNPVGAHDSGRIGEDPHGVPTNLFPILARVAAGKLPQLQVYGGDYPTPDGTGVRDYIHVVDLARGHVKALAQLEARPGVVVYNLGTGRGTSVLEAVAAFEEASGRRIPYAVVPRRPGDVAECYTDPGKARDELGWSAQQTLGEMCVDSWRWQQANPRGYE